MSNRKTAIMTLYHAACPNYGNSYQNYACERIYEQLGYGVETIVKEKPFTHINLLKYQGYRMVNYVFGCRLSSKQGLWKRYIVFRKFERKHLHIRFISPMSLSTTDYDYYSIGSDQVWNPNWIRKPEDVNWFFCSDIPAEKCICLSPSFGVDSIPEERKKEYSALLGRIVNLSVREDSGREIIQDLTGKEAPVLIDPTLALSKAEWDCVQKKPRFVRVDAQFILCYFLGGLSEERRIIIQRYANQRKWQLLDLMDEKSKLFTLGPSEFLWLLAHARAVCTDSFHASVFSIIYQRPLFVFKREGVNDYMFSRLETLLKKFHLENRIVDREIDLTTLIECDYSESQAILIDEQEKMWAYLNNALGRGRQ